MYTSVFIVLLFFFSAAIAFFLAHTKANKDRKIWLIIAGFGQMMFALMYAYTFGPHALLATAIIIPIWIFTAVIAPVVVRRLKMDSA